MRISAISAGIFLISLITGVCAFSQDVPVIKDIKVENLGAGPIDNNFVFAHISAKPGSPFDRLSAARDVKSLLAAGCFSDVRVEAEQLDAGIRLIYSIRNKLKLAEPIEITGADLFRESKIRSLIELKVGDFVDEQVLHVREQPVKIGRAHV